MAASLEPPPRPKWRLSDPSRPGDRLIFSALSCFRVSIIRGRYVHQHEVGGTDHLERRMNERDIDLADVLRTVATGTICIFPHRGHDWIGGGFLADGIMVYAQAFVPPGSGDFAKAVPLLSTAWRLSPAERQLAPTMPAPELSCPANAG